MSVWFGLILVYYICTSYHARLTSRHKETKQKKNRQSHKYKYKHVKHTQMHTAIQKSIHGCNNNKKYGIHIEIIFDVKHVRMWMKWAIHNNKKAMQSKAYSNGKTRSEKRKRREKKNKIPIDCELCVCIYYNTNMCYVWILRSTWDVWVVI